MHDPAPAAADGAADRESLVLPAEGSEMRRWLEVALRACDDADATALRSFRRDMRVETKPDRSFVTEADQAIERAIRSDLLAAFPDHGLVGEEYGEHDGEARCRWIIDPIDGTHNYMRGVPLFGTLLGLQVDGEMTVGVMSAPALHTRWFAWRGGGAWRVDLVPGGWQRSSARRLHVSGVSRLEEAQILYSSIPEITRSGKAPGFAGVLERVWRDRGFGDFWGYALVAEGAAEAMLEIGVKPWDLAGPQVVVEEAGGRFTDLDGRRSIDGLSILVTNGILHEPMLHALREGGS
jgi:histidinol-phosphatase